MAAQLVLSNANVTGPDVASQGVQIQVRMGQARILERGTRTVLSEKAGVVAVAKPAPRAGRWVVTFDDGTAWDVLRVLRPCGCR